MDKRWQPHASFGGGAWSVLRSRDDDAWEIWRNTGSGSSFMARVEDIGQDAVQAFRNWMNSIPQD
jgi:hypothetical protein